MSALTSDAPARQPDIVACGDGAVLIRFEERIDVAINRRVHVLADAVRGARLADPELGVPVPSYASLLVPFDPLATTAEDVERRLHELLRGLPLSADPAPGPAIEIAVRYGGDDGPDLDEVAARTGLTPAQVAELHASVEYRAFVLGFAPGFAYLGELPSALELPRRQTPRQRVAAGSVAIAGRQTAIYPHATPGGWHLIGRTDARLWDVLRDPPALIAPGRAVRFVPV